MAKHSILPGRGRSTHDDETKRPDPSEGSLASVVELVTTYAKQETIGPLKGAGRFLAFGGAGAVVMALGFALILFGALRLVQTEWTWAASGSWSWIAYLPVVAAGTIVIAVAAFRIYRSSLDPVNEPEAALKTKEHR